MAQRDPQDANATRSERAAARPVERPLAPSGDAVAPTVIAQELAPGDRVGDYEVCELIGSGTFGVVARAVHAQLGREVALKLLKRAHAADAQLLGRFLAEARAVNRIRHPNIVDVYAFGELPDGRQYYVMDLLRGRSLAEALCGGRRLSLDEALRILEPLADALATAHGAGITHRDLKPENVFLQATQEGERPVLLDFGIAQMPPGVAPQRPATRAGMVLGTPCYMAPEQALGEAVDARADVFALGVLTFQMLAGVLPWDGASLSEVVKQQLHGAPPKLGGVPDYVQDAVGWMLTAEVSKRCPDVRTAIAALHGRSSRAPAREAEVVALPSLTRLAEAEERAERSGFGRLAFSLGLVALLFAGGLFALDRRAPPPSVEFVFEGRPVRAEVVSHTGEVLGLLPGKVMIPAAELPTTVEVRAPGYRSERRELRDGELKVHLVTLSPQ